MATASLLASAMCAGLFAAVSIANPGALWRPGIDGDFYSVMPHLAMVSLFGIVGLAVAAALAVGSVRCWRDMEGARAPLTPKALRRAFGDAFSLRHLHGAGDDCVSAEERRTPWRRWCHHCTFYGFGLCTASTTVAAAYHASGVVAPYAYGSLPVVLGTLGGAGLLVGPVGLWVLGQRRDPALMDPERPGLDDALLVLLFATSLTGLLLLIFREHAAMGLLLVVHLGVVLALFLSLPYGKFVHGLYRLLALLKYARESEERGGADS
jgi:citrate/tricarballylate utilization protein